MLIIICGSTPRELIFFCGSTPRMLKSVCGSTPRDPLLICGSTPWVPCSDSMTWHYRHSVNGDSIFPFDTDPIGYKVATLPGGAWWQGGDVSVQATESPGLVTREPGPGCWGSEWRSLQERREQDGSCELSWHWHWGIEVFSDHSEDSDNDGRG